MLLYITVSAEAREKSISIVLKKGFGNVFAKILGVFQNSDKKNNSVRSLFDHNHHNLLSGIYNGVFHNHSHRHSAEAESFAVLKENLDLIDLVDEDKVFGDKFKMDQV